MTNYTIAETLKLPSKGKVYEYNVPEEVTVRSMTVAEEQKRLAITDYPYKMLCEIIDDCIVEDIDMSSYDMCIGDYQALLYKLRTVTYGPDYTMEIRCPYCGYTNKETINLDDLPVKEYTPDFDDLRDIVLPMSKKSVRIKVQTPRMLDKVNERAREYKRKFPGTPDPTLTLTLTSLIELLDGGKPDPVKLEDWVKSLPMADVNAIITRAEKVNGAIGIDNELIVNCELCGLDHLTGVAMSKEFFRPSI